METINLTVRSTERFGSFNFVVATDQEGSFYAYREIEPLFCFKGDSEDEVLETVSNALEFYKTNYA